MRLDPARRDFESRAERTRRDRIDLRGAVPVGQRRARRARRDRAAGGLPRVGARVLRVGRGGPAGPVSS